MADLVSREFHLGFRYSQALQSYNKIVLHYTCESTMLFFEVFPSIFSLFDLTIRIDQWARRVVELSDLAASTKSAVMGPQFFNFGRSRSLCR